MVGSEKTGFDQGPCGSVVVSAHRTMTRILRACNNKKERVYQKSVNVRQIG